MTDTHIKQAAQEIAKLHNEASTGRDAPDLWSPEHVEHILRRHCHEGHCRSAYNALLAIFGDMAHDDAMKVAVAENNTFATRAFMAWAFLKQAFGPGRYDPQQAEPSGDAELPRYLGHSWSIHGSDESSWWIVAEVIGGHVYLGRDGKVHPDTEDFNNCLFWTTLADAEAFLRTVAKEQGGEG
jgi:hypothetical protein